MYTNPLKGDSPLN